MKLPSKEKVRSGIGVLMIGAFIVICVAASIPVDDFKEFAINFAKSIGTLCLLAGGVWLIMKNNS